MGLIILLSRYFLGERYRKSFTVVTFNSESSSAFLGPTPLIHFIESDILRDNNLKFKGAQLLSPLIS
jgi:hypothetical protein